MFFEKKSRLVGFVETEKDGTTWEVFQVRFLGGEKWGVLGVWGALGRVKPRVSTGQVV